MLLINRGGFIAWGPRASRIYGDFMNWVNFQPFFHILLICSCCGFLFSDEAKFPGENEPLVLNLTNAVSQALNCNRQLLGTLDSLTYSKYGVELAESEFNIQIVPNGRAGYVGGGHAGTGWSVGGGVDVKKKFKTGTELSIGPTILKAVDHYFTEVRAMVSQPLLRGLGKDYQLANIMGAQFTLRTAYRNLYIAQVQLVVRTIQALYEVVKAEKSLFLNQESYQRIRQFYQAAKLKEKIGLADALDVYRAEIELRHAEDILTGVHERLQESEDIVRDLLALPLDAGIKIDLPLNYTPNTVELEDAIQLALDNRIEVDQSEDEMGESRRLSSLAKKNLKPELNLVFNYANAGRDEIFTRTWTGRRESTWGVGFTTSTEFNAVGDRIAYDQSLLEAEAALRGIDQTRALIVLEVKKMMRQLNRDSERIHLQEDQIKTAEGELHLAKVKFDRGMADNFNVIQAEKSLKGAQQVYWSALIDHIVGEFQLLAAVGLLIDKPCIR